MPELREVREALLRSHFQAIESSHDVDKVLEAFSHPRYEVPALGVVADGREAASGFLAALFAAFPDFRVMQQTFYHADNAVIVETRVRGTHRGTWIHVPATGKTVEVQTLSVFRFDGEKLMGETVYLDHATVLRQMGALQS